MSRALYLFVENFSNEKRECFFEKELPYHCAKFDKVYVLSLYPKENRILKFEAPNLEVLYFNYFEPCNRISAFFRHFSRIMSVVKFELAHTHNRRFYFKNVALLLNQLVLQCAVSDRLQSFLKQKHSENAVFYTYWFKQWTIALSLIKKRHSSLKLVSRVHGGDYDEDQIRSTFPFRYFQLAMLDHVFPVSDFGTHYLIKKFGVSSNRITTARLGLSIEPKKSVTDPSLLHLVSCSYVIELKRVHLIVDILERINIPCKWTHFGDGPLLEAVKTKAKDLIHEVDFRGYVPNGDFIRYLQENAVSLFINVSESEGIPVSMMEAIAHGIPLVGTDVCGVPEIVTQTTGFLFPVDFQPEAVAAKITALHYDQSIYQPGFRERIVEFYKTNYFQDNYIALSEQMAGI